ncbi:MAG: hypothetical protein QHH14_02690 [Clostridiales bacterium]|nr:hypothetical protein [Clostridiales bacterium]
MFALIFFPFRSLHPWFAMVFISFLTGLLMLFVFRLTSNQKGIRQVKDKIKAHLLELRLFKDSLPVTLKAQGQILKHNLKYISYSAKPMLVMIIPLLVILAQLNLWFGYEALRAGDTALVKVVLKKSVAPFEADVELEAPPGLAVETPPLRLVETGEVYWRIRAKKEGVHELRVKLAGQNVTKTVIVTAKPLARVCPMKSASLLDGLLFPGEKLIPSRTPLTFVEIIYPAKRLNLAGLGLHWLIPYLVLSVLFGFIFKRPFRVEI